MGFYKYTVTYYLNEDQQRRLAELAPRIDALTDRRPSPPASLLQLMMSAGGSLLIDQRLDVWESWVSEREGQNVEADGKLY